jgi:hypothetical protein
MCLSRCLLSLKPKSNKEFREADFDNEANGDSRCTYERVLPWLVPGARHACTRVFALPWLLWSAQHKIYLHYFNSFVPIAQQAGQGVVPGRLSLNSCLCVWSACISIACNSHQRKLGFDQENPEGRYTGENVAIARRSE